MSIPVVRSNSRVVLIDPDPWRAESLRSFLQKERMIVGGEDDHGGLPDLILVNLCERASEMRARLERLKARWPDAKVVAFVREVDTHTVFPCLLQGVKGILPYDASPKEILMALGTVQAGSIWTPRPVLAQWIDRIVTLGVTGATDRTFTRSEQRVLEGVREELSNKEIARRLGVTEATVKFHVGKLLKKTGARDRRELAKFVTASSQVAESA